MILYDGIDLYCSFRRVPLFIHFQIQMKYLLNPTSEKKNMQPTKKDLYLLFAARSMRLFSYGSLAVVLYLYLKEIGLDQKDIGVLLTFIMLGDIIITMFLTTHADRFGRRKTLALGALLKVFTGILFALSTNFYALIFTGIVGVISTTGGDIGPFLAIEQAALTDLKENISSGEIATLFGWYNLFGCFSQAFGAMTAGATVWTLTTHWQLSKLDAYRVVIISYAFWGIGKWILYNMLSDKVECATYREFLNKSPEQILLVSESSKRLSNRLFGLKRDKTIKVIIQLSLLFSIDAFAAGLVTQTFLSYWFSTKWGVEINRMGSILMATNILSGLSGLAASKLVNIIGAVQTIVLTHLPSNLLLMSVPLMPTSLSSVLMLFSRFSISQMDVPARQAYVAMVVESDERCAAVGITNIARSAGLALSPLLLGNLIKAPLHSWLFSSPFLIGGALMIVYDITLGLCFLRSKAKFTREEEPLNSKQLHDINIPELVNDMKETERGLNSEKVQKIQSNIIPGQPQVYV